MSLNMYSSPEKERDFLQELKEMGILDENGELQRTLKIGKNEPVLPIVQGGMGIGISTAGLVGAVAFEGGVGTLSAAAIQMIPAYHEYWVKTIKEAKINAPSGILSKDDTRRLFKEANIFCIKEEIRKAKEIAQGNGKIFINIMVASRDYDDCVKAACESGVDGIVSGAGMPRHLPGLTKEFPEVALIPILSTERGVKVITDHWKEKYGKAPDAIVLEDPSKAGGHLGAGNLEAVNNENSKLCNTVPAVRIFLDNLDLKNIPVIAAGGISTREDMAKAFKLGANAVQMGTSFLATKESGANEQFKNSIVEATKKDIRVIRSSAGLPFRALRTSGTLNREGGAKDREAHTRECLRNCLIHCGFTRGIVGVTQMCIIKELIRSTKGGREDGLMTTGDFFDDDGKPKITSILSVKERMNGYKYWGKD